MELFVTAAQLMTMKVDAADVVQALRVKFGLADCFTQDGVVYQMATDKFNDTMSIHPAPHKADRYDVLGALETLEDFIKKSGRK